MEQHDENVLSKRVALAVKRHRQWCDLTQAQLGRRANVTQSTVSQVEKGKHTSLKTLERLSAALGLKLSELIQFAEGVGDAQTVKEEIAAFLARQSH